MRAVGDAFRTIRNRLFEGVNSGDACFCVVCGNSYREFMAQGSKGDLFKKHKIAGMGFKKNVRCPNCRSKPRVRLLYLFFEYRTDIYQKRVRVLHISPHRYLAKELSRHGNIDYVSGALFPDRLPAIPTVKVDVTDIGFTDQQFDLVICNHVFEHVQEDERAMREIFRVLRPGGFAVLQVPLALDLLNTLEDPSILAPRDREVNYGQKDHLRLYGLDYFEKLKAAGFRVERDNPFTNRWLPDLGKHRLNEDEDVYIGIKG